MTLKEKAKKIKMFLMDVDGVLTDGKIIYDSSDNEIKAFNVKDGLGIGLLHIANIKTGIITARISPMVEKRVKELKINEVFQGKRKKIESYEAIKEKYNLKDEDILYIGDDLVDIPILDKVGFPVSVVDAPEIVKRSCIYITKRRGGDGAVRETVEFLLKLQNRYEKVIKEFLTKHE